MTSGRMDERVLILAPRGRDADVIGRLLAGGGIFCLAVADLDALLTEIEDGAAVAIVTEEALAALDEAPLVEWLDRQAPWSDLPFVILATKQMGRRSTQAADRLRSMGNVVLLERPLNGETLISAVTS